ncbi:MAG TPA: hypothetical protein VF837_05185 [Patescibacteria group bacterium]
MADDEFFESLMVKENPTSEDVRKARQEAKILLRKGRKMVEEANRRLSELQGICRHHRKTGYVCPDCGIDSSPDWQ